MNRTLYAKLADRLAEDVETLRRADEILRKHQTAKAARAFPQKLKAAAKIRRPTAAIASTNGDGRVFPLTVPSKLNFRQKKALPGYLLQQIARAAGGPFTAKDATASFKAARVPYRGQVLGAAIRYGMIKRAPGGTTTHKLFTLGANVSPEFEQAD